MVIPNDKGYPYRLLKYVEYHMSVPPIEPATILAYCKMKKLNKEECLWLAWYNSMCYCSPTALFLFNNLDKDYCKFWESEKDKLLFVSARRYVKNMNWFVPLMNQFVSKVHEYGSCYDWLKSLTSNSSEDNYQKVYNELIKWQYMGRFSVELFTDMIVQMYQKGLIDIPFTSNDCDFNFHDGSNVTSGLLNMFYRDEEADQYDKTHIVSKELEQELWCMLKEVQSAIAYYHPEQNVGISVITPKICSWRNLFKGKRYGGYHHDRQLEQLIHYQSQYPNNSLWDDLYDLRSKEFNHNLLGELGGWKGIRKERKRLWLDHGLTGVENV